jgi:hypothetical protein
VLPPDLHATKLLLQEARYYSLADLVSRLCEHAQDLNSRQLQADKATAKFRQELLKV